MRNFWGFERPDGTVGVRNYVAVLSTVCCANPVAEHIAQDVSGAVALCHSHGCGRRLERPLHNQCLIGMGSNPNVYGTIVVSLGCEGTPADAIVEGIRKTGRPVELLVIQKEGSVKTTQRGIELAKKMVAQAAQEKRKEFPVSKLMLGMECGGSDALSGVTSNPIIGRLSDWLVSQGGTTVLTEITELIGTAKILTKRAANANVAKDIEAVISEAQKNTHAVLGENAARAIAPGNMDGGMSTIQEKALGCVHKGGTSTINQVVGYGQKPTQKGLVIMDGPGFDTESLTGMASMGCQVMFFSTGRGNPIGFPIVPVVKVASNSELYQRMRDDMDVNAGSLLEGSNSFADLERDMVDLLIKVANGEETKAEKNKQGGIVCLWSWSKSL